MGEFFGYFLEMLHQELDIPDKEYNIQIRSVRKDDTKRNEYQIWKTFYLGPDSGNNVQATVDRQGVDNFFSAFEFVRSDLATETATGSNPLALLVTMSSKLKVTVQRGQLEVFQNELSHCDKQPFAHTAMIVLDDLPEAVPGRAARRALQSGLKCALTGTFVLFRLFEGDITPKLNKKIMLIYRSYSQIISNFKTRAMLSTGSSIPKLVGLNPTITRLIHVRCFLAAIIYVSGKLQQLQESSHDRFPPQSLQKFRIHVGTSSLSLLRTTSLTTRATLFQARVALFRAILAPLFLLSQAIRPRRVMST